MTRPQVELQFDRADATYRAGEQVAGWAIVTVRDSFLCRELRLTREWRTHGRGNVNSGPGPVQSLYELIALSPTDGEDGLRRYRYAFSFEAAAWPASYDGHHVKLSWYLRATAFLRPALTVSKAAQSESASHGSAVGELLGATLTAESCFRVIGGAQVADGVGAPEVVTQTKAEAIDKRGRAIGGIFVVLGLLMPGLGWVLSDLRQAPFVCAGLALATVGALILLPAAWNLFAELKLGPVVVALDDRARAGGELTVGLLFIARRRVELNRISLRLVGQEKARSGTGPDLRTFVHVLHEDRAELCASSMLLEPGEAFNEEASFKLPLDAAPSLSLDDNTIKWTVEVCIDIPDWPDWSLEHGVEVLPSSAINIVAKRITVSVQPRQRCPYCHETIGGRRPAQLVTCAGCRAVLHKACIAELGACSTRGCRNARSGRTRA